MAEYLGTSFCKSVAKLNLFVQHPKKKSPANLPTAGLLSPINQIKLSYSWLVMRLFGDLVICWPELGICAYRQNEYQALANK